jgi:hypothetical protein
VSQPQEVKIVSGTGLIAFMLFLLLCRACDINDHLTEIRDRLPKPAQVQPK